MNGHTDSTIHSLDAAALQTRLDAFASLLHAAVHAGANINFVLPFSLEEAAGFWQESVLPPLAAKQRLLFAAMEGEQAIGTVQLDLAMPPNQPHRADVAKLMVHPDHRRRGLGRQLMQALLAEAVARDLKLLVLDTVSGSPAERLYRDLGFQVAGQIPDFCLDPIVERLDPTTIMYKRL